MLVRMDEGVLIAVGCGERDEAASQAESAGCHAHRYGKGAAGRVQGRVATDADLAGYTEGTGCQPTRPDSPDGGCPLVVAPSGSLSVVLCLYGPFAFAFSLRGGLPSWRRTISAAARLTPDGSLTVLDLPGPPAYALVTCPTGPGPVRWEVPACSVPGASTTARPRAAMECRMISADDHVEHAWLPGDLWQHRILTQWPVPSRLRLRPPPHGRVAQSVSVH
jgi:hypothetical protein